MSCLLRLLLFDVFYGVYLGGVSVFSDVVLLFVDTTMVLNGDLYHDTFTSQNECFTIFKWKNAPRSGPIVFEKCHLRRYSNRPSGLEFYGHPFDQSPFQKVKVSL